MPKNRYTTLSLDAGSIKLAQALAGPNHAHIADIEAAFGVDIRPSSTMFDISGDLKDVEAAAEAMNALLVIASEHTLEREDVTSILHHGGHRGRASVSTRKKTISARTPRQSDYLNAIESNDLVFGIGPAGTGKTYLAVAYAAQQLEAGNIERIILTRPAVEAGERLGFLPGDLKEKIDPFLRPVYDALFDVMPPERVNKAIEAGSIEIAPLAFMRGRTLNHAVVIIDEAQNTTSTQMKMALTRLGDNSKMIVTGDATQIDLPRGQISGLKEAVAILSDVEGVDVISFDTKDVVRHALVGRIVDAYAKYEGPADA